MKTSWFSRAAAVALAAAASLLAACGSGSTVQQLTPTRFMAVGDGMIDLGHDGKRYTINDGSMLWTQQLASHFGLTLADSSTGGLSYARGNARITAADPTGGGAPSLSAQVDALLARLNPWAAIVAALFYADMMAGADQMQSSAEVPKSLVDLIRGLIILMITATFVWNWRRRRGGAKNGDNAPAPQTAACPAEPAGDTEGIR